MLHVGVLLPVVADMGSPTLRVLFAGGRFAYLNNQDPLGREEASSMSFDSEAGTETRSFESCTARPTRPYCLPTAIAGFMQ